MIEALLALAAIYGFIALVNHLEKKRIKRNIDEYNRRIAAAQKAFGYNKMIFPTRKKTKLDKILE